MKRLTIVLCILVLGLVAAVPALAQDQHECDHQGTALESLRMCLEHAYLEGHIDSAGILASLLDKVDDAETAVANEDIVEAVSTLKALDRAIAAQSGKHIVAEHATHLREHTQHAIEALKQL